MCDVEYEIWVVSYSYRLRSTGYKVQVTRVHGKRYRAKGIGHKGQGK